VTDELIDIFLVPAQERSASAAFVKIMQGMTSSSFSPNIRKLLPGMDLPMLLIWGLEDRMIPPQTADILIKLNPRMESINLAAAGHCAHDESPNEVNQLIRNWLDSMESHDLPHPLHCGGEQEAEIGGIIGVGREDVLVIE
jgi:pimeloyl-ACP methyl ester carboxylesterase